VRAWTDNGLEGPLTAYGGREMEGVKKGRERVGWREGETDR